MRLHGCEDVVDDPVAADAQNIKKVDRQVADAVTDRFSADRGRDGMVDRQPQRRRPTQAFALADADRRVPGNRTDRGIVAVKIGHGLDPFDRIQTDGGNLAGIQPVTVVQRVVGKAARRLRQTDRTRGFGCGIERHSDPLFSSAVVSANAANISAASCCMAVGSTLVT